MDENMNNNENEDIFADFDFDETNTNNVSNVEEQKIEEPKAETAKKIFNGTMSKAKEIFEKNKKYFMIGAGVLAAIIIIAILFSTIGKGKAGNSIGNLANGGFAAGKSSEIYYIKLDEGEGDGVYKSKGDKSEEVLDESLMFLNVDGGYLYGIIEDEDSSYKYNLIKVKTNGKKQEKLVKDVDMSTPITVVDGWVYYGKDDNFYKIKTNGKDREKISSKKVLSYQIEGKWIYYSYYKDGEIIIAKMKTNGEDNQKMIDEVSSSFFVDGGKVYYIEAKHNKKTYEYTYKLCKVKTNGKDSEEICKLKGNNISSINLNEDGVFYVSTDEEADEYIIYNLDYKGKENKKVTKTSIAPTINVVGNYILYNDFNKDDEEVMFKIKINGEDKVELK